MTTKVLTTANPCPRYLLSDRPDSLISHASQLRVDPVAAIAGTPGPSQLRLTAAFAPFLTETDLHELDRRGLANRSHDAIAADGVGNLLRIATRDHAPRAWQHAAIENLHLSAAGVASLAQSPAPDVRERAQQNLVKHFAVEPESFPALMTHIDHILNCPDRDLAEALTAATDHFPNARTVLQLLKLFRHRHTPVPPDAGALITDRLLRTNRVGSTRGDLVYFLVVDGALAPENLQTLLTNTPAGALELLDLTRGLLKADVWPQLTNEQVAWLGDREIGWEPWMRLSSAMAETLLDHGPRFQLLAVNSGAASADTVNTMARDHLGAADHEEKLLRALLASPQLTRDTIDYALTHVEAHAGTENDRIATLRGLAANPNLAAPQQQRLLTFNLTPIHVLNPVPEHLAQNPNLDPEVGVTIARALNARAANAAFTVAIDGVTTKHRLLTNPRAAAARQYLPARLYWSELDMGSFLVTELDAHLDGDPHHWAEFAVLAPEWDDNVDSLLQAITALSLF